MFVPCLFMLNSLVVPISERDKLEKLLNSEYEVSGSQYGTSDMSAGTAKEADKRRITDADEAHGD